MPASTSWKFEKKHVMIFVEDLHEIATVGPSSFTLSRVVMLATGSTSSTTWFRA
jgi:hypothetical protein